MEINQFWNTGWIKWNVFMGLRGCLILRGFCFGPIFNAMPREERLCYVLRSFSAVTQCMVYACATFTTFITSLHQKLLCMWQHRSCFDSHPILESLNSCLSASSFAWTRSFSILAFNYYGCKPRFVDNQPSLYGAFPTNSFMLEGTGKYPREYRTSATPHSSIGSLFINASAIDSKFCSTFYNEELYKIARRHAKLHEIARPAKSSTPDRAYLGFHAICKEE